jgi:hypothetical protein
LLTLVSGSTTRTRRHERRPSAALLRVLSCFALLSIACTLTQGGFEPNEVQGLESSGDAGGESDPNSTCSGARCCSESADCEASQQCVNGSCQSACAAGEDLSTCQVPLCPGPGCPEGAPSCTDGVQNGREPAADCGEVCPNQCEAGEACNGAADCTSGRCEGSLCVDSSCVDGVQNAGEPAVDCGRVCPTPCPVGTACTADADCESGAFCAPATRLCTDGSCQDGAQSEGEVLTDCGGGDCPGCPVGSPCLEASDCESRVCDGGVCGVASCTDGLSSGDEPGIDCGGADPECPRCPDTDPCGDGSDCASGACEAGRCVSCEDSAENGTETDTDCGGGNPQCPRCGTGASCIIDDDCASQSCGAGLCVAVSCSDDLQNGSESDTDCGGGNPQCPRCAAGDSCVTGADCVSQVCSNGSCSPCGDGVRNGTESDTDCGGADLACGRCLPGDTCQADSDCSSGACAGGTCCGGSLGDCTRCAERLSQNVSCDFPTAGVDSTGVSNCNAFLGCLTANASRCPTRNTPGCSGDNQASDACPHNNYGGNAGTGVTRATLVLQDAGCQL